jgi:hypothetical protein
MQPNYQGSAFQVSWPLQIASGASAQFRIVCEAEKLEG